LKNYLSNNSNLLLSNDQIENALICFAAMLFLNPSLNYSHLRFMHDF